MNRQQLRKPFLRRWRRWKHTHVLLGLTLAFLSALFTFLITFYATSDYFLEFVTSLVSTSSNNNARFQQFLPNIAENYRPRDFSGKSQSVQFDYHITYNDFDYLKPETLNYKSKIYPNNIEILFRFPKKTSVLALLLIFHACNHSAYDWFHTIERQRIIGAAIDLGYACLVFQATDKNSRCWSNDADIYANHDVNMVFKGLEGFYYDFPKLASLPRFTFGSSSGGIFSSIFAINQVYAIQGQILFISIILPEILYTYVKPKSYPTTAWIHMLRDIEFASEERINVSQQIFIEHNISHNTFPIEPIPLTHTVFHERIPSISSDTSNYIVYRLQQNQWLNSHKFLTHNPRRKLAWQSFVFTPTLMANKNLDMFDNLNKSRSLIGEFLNTIYGEHEISYERSFEALKWLKETYIASKNITESNK